MLRKVLLMLVRVERFNKSKLQKKIYSFYYHIDMQNPSIRLSDYCHMKRPSTRHKFRPYKFYGGNGSFGYLGEQIKREDFKLPKDIVQETKSIIIKSIKAIDTV